MNCPCIPSLQTNNEYIERMNEHFTSDHLDYNVFCSILQESNAIISGGTILRMLNNDKGDQYIGADVDIYVNKSKLSILMKHLNNIFDYSKIPLTDSKGNIYYRNEYNGIQPININNTEGYASIHPNIIELYSYICRRKRTYKDTHRTTFQALSYIRPYQIIVLEDCISPQEFVKVFDITFCQNYFDGNKFFSYHPNCVKARKGYCTKVIDEEHQYRINKYEKRGYTILK